MNSLTFLERVAILTGVLVLITVLLVSALAVVGYVGLSMTPPAELALGLLIAVSFLAAVGLGIALGAGIVAFGLLAVALFVLMLIAGGSLGLAVLVVIGFLVLASLVLALSPNAVALSIPLFSGLFASLFLLPLLALLLHLIRPGTALVAISIAGSISLLLFYAWLVLGMHRLPLRLLGLGGLTNMPAIPFRIIDLPDTVIRLLNRQSQEETAKNALTKVFTLRAGTPDARTANGHTFLFGTDEEKSYCLDKPEQFAMSWTTLDGTDLRGAPLLPTFSAALTNTAAAEAAFWPNFARFFSVFGVVPLQRVTQEDAAHYRNELGTYWISLRMDDMLPPAGHSDPGASRLYVIDMSIFGKMPAPTVFGSRFTPDTLTFLSFNAATQKFTPFLIRVSNGVTSHVYVSPGVPITVPTSAATAGSPDPAVIAASTWLYALQAAKASITTWGIWLGHVYRFHIVTAALQMTMFQHLPTPHPVRQVLGRQSQYLIPFDVVLLLVWNAITFFPPPTSMNTSIQYLELTDNFAENRNFFDDEPQVTLDSLGLSKKDFTTPLFTVSEILNLPGLVARLKAHRPNDPPAGFLLDRLWTAAAFLDAGGSEQQLAEKLVFDMNAVITGSEAFPDGGFVLSPETFDLRHTMRAISPFPPSPPTPDLARLNRLLMQDAFAGLVKKMDWNLYPVARYLLEIFEATKNYVNSAIDAIYPDEDEGSDVADVAVQQWLAASQNPSQGNVKGLPLPLISKYALKQLLTSLIYRITAHGLGRLNPVANPVLTFMSNFPPCLEDSRIPDPNDPNSDGSALSTDQLLAFLPKTKTLGELFSFIAAFTYTDPYVPFIPVNWTPAAPANDRITGGHDWEIHPFTGPAAPGCDAALQKFRSDLQMFITFFLADSNDQNFATSSSSHTNFQPTLAQIHQWELNIEL